MRKARTDRYNILCSIDAHEKQNQSYCDDSSRDGVFTLPSNSATEALDFLSATIFFIDCWLKALEQNFIERCNLYSHNMDKLFQKIPVKLPNRPISKEKHQSLLHDIGGGWYVEN